MTKTQNIILLYFAGLLFIAINVYLAIEKNTLLGISIPIILFIVFLFLFHFEKIFFLAAVTTPLALDLVDARFDLGLSIPTEILLIGLMMIFFGKLILGQQIDRKIMRHPVSIAIIIYLIWIFITTLTSVRPVVSFKFLFSRMWFIIPMFFMMTQLVKKSGNINKFLWCYIVPLLIVCCYTLIRHAGRGFSQQSGHWVMAPFYNDHTAYGAVLALFFPLLVGLSFSKQYSKKQRLVYFMVMGFLTIATIFSYCRAAWLSLVIALGACILIVLKIKFRYIFLTICLLVGIFFAFQNQIIYTLEKNQDDSSSDFSQHLRSITNISTDASNVERLNRWSSAIRMFEVKPLFGWGPGTYQFEYAPFQTSESKSIVSTNHGDMGNAHSEYLGPLAESGFPGMLSFLAIAILSIYYGIKVYQRQKNKKLKQIALLLTLGLITYFSHGIMNNFLDTDKLAVPFWGFIAILVSLDVYYKEEEDTEPVVMDHKTKKDE